MSDQAVCCRKAASKAGLCNRVNEPPNLSLLSPHAVALVRVLLVDDTRSNQVLIGKYLRDLGHQVILASDGVEAIEIYQQQAPDLVLLDVMMPKMDGYQVTLRIRDLEGESAWTPIIFLSAKFTDKDIATGIEVGGDDYLSKPVSKVVLAAKMRAMSRIAQMRSTIQDYAQAQAQINQRDAQERELARHVFDRMTRLQNLDHDWIKHVSRPSSHFSGDIIAAETTPGGDLHLILGDATGHGLAAGLTVMPLADLFHALTARGESLVTIARRVNERLHDLLPTGRFVATIMVAVKPATRTIEVWNGGCPPVYWINTTGGVKTTFDSLHLPLGVLREITDNRSTSVNYDPENPGKLYLFTDGVPDAESLTTGKQFTLGRVGELLAVNTEDRLGRLMETLESHIGEMTAQDDISIVEISPPQREMVGDQQLLFA